MVLVFRVLGLRGLGLRNLGAQILGLDGNDDFARAFHQQS